jgi:hypothetical protein
MCTRNPGLEPAYAGSRPGLSSCAPMGQSASHAGKTAPWKPCPCGVIDSITHPTQGALADSRPWAVMSNAFGVKHFTALEQTQSRPRAMCYARSGACLDREVLIVTTVPKMLRWAQGNYGPGRSSLVVVLLILQRGAFISHARHPTRRPSSYVTATTVQLPLLSSATNLRQHGPTPPP